MSRFLGDGQQRQRLPARKGSKVYKTCMALELAGFSDLARSLAVVERALTALDDTDYERGKHWVSALSRAKHAHLSALDGHVYLLRGDETAIRLYQEWKTLRKKEEAEFRDLSARARELLR